MEPKKQEEKKRKLKIYLIMLQSATKKKINLKFK